MPLKMHSVLVDLSTVPKHAGWRLICSEAERPPADGLWIWMPTGHITEFYLLEHIKKRLSERPISWLTVSEEYWLFDADKAKLSIAEVGYMLSRRPIEWPDWLTGVVEVEPKYESGPNFKSRLSIRITQATYQSAERRMANIAKMSAPAQMVVQQFFSREVHMGTQYNVSGGQVGAMGEHATSEGNTFNQLWTQAAAGLDLSSLAKELGELRVAMKREAIEVEQDQAVSYIGLAEVAAKNGESSSALRHLKAAGSWALDAATKIGTTVAAKAIQQALGLP